MTPVVRDATLTAMADTIAETIGEIRRRRLSLALRCECQLVFIPAPLIPGALADGLTLAEAAARYRCSKRCGQRPSWWAAATDRDRTGRLPKMSR